MPGKLTDHVSSSSSQFLKNAINVNIGNIVRRFLIEAEDKGSSKEEVYSQIETHFMTASDVYNEIKNTQNPEDKMSKIRGIANVGKKLYQNYWYVFS